MLSVHLIISNKDDGKLYDDKNDEFLLLSKCKKSNIEYLRILELTKIMTGGLSL